MESLALAKDHKIVKQEAQVTFEVEFVRKQLDLCFLIEQGLLRITPSEKRHRIILEVGLIFF